MSSKSEGAADKEEHTERVIPIRRVPLSDQTQLPADYSVTPGGTYFSTTPGGTRIIYDREFLMQCRHSPLTKTPPANLPNIPGVTHPINSIAHRENMELLEDSNGPVDQPSKIPDGSGDPQFPMDI